MRVSSYKFELNGVCYPKPKAGKYARQLKSWRDSYGKKPCEKKEINKYNVRELFKFLNTVEFDNTIKGFLRKRHYNMGYRIYKGNKSYICKNYDDRVHKMEIELSNKDIIKKSYQKKYISKLRDCITTDNDEYIDDAIQAARIFIYKNLYEYKWDYLLKKACWKSLQYITKLRKEIDRESNIDVYSYGLEQIGYSDETETQTVFVNKLLNSLSKEQRQIINLISQGLSQCEIAGKLHISRRKLNYKLSELRQYAKSLSRDF